MSKYWSFAVILDTGVSVDNESDYDEASNELDVAMLDWANGTPVSQYFKDISEDCVDLQEHNISWVIEAADRPVDVFAIMCKVMIEVKSSTKPDIMKPNLRTTMLSTDKLSAICPGVKLSKKFFGSRDIEPSQ